MTERFSSTLDDWHATALRRLADYYYGGNISAAIRGLLDGDQRVTKLMDRLPETATART